MTDNKYIINGNNKIYIQSNPPAATSNNGIHTKLGEKLHHHEKNKRRDKSDLGENFVAPDGGWGWIVAIAAGIDIIFTLAPYQNFGIIFRNRLFNLGITSSQMTTIANMQISLSSLTGLLNGPLFKRFTYRQVSILGAAFLFIGLFLSAFADSFIFFLVSFSFFYGIGRGLIASGTLMVVTTYFVRKRRTAVAYQWGVAGVGPILMPFVITQLLIFYGVQGTVLLIAGLSLHTIACGLIFQPVKWHVKKPKTVLEAESSHNKHEEIDLITGPDTPIFAHANDGWYGSRVSLNALGTRSRQNSIDHNGEKCGRELKRLNSISLHKTSFSITYSIKEIEPEESEIDEKEHSTPLNMNSYEKKCHPETFGFEVDDENEERKTFPFYKKVIIFFDLDLLRDFTFINLAIGLTLINFVDLNFALLTPFILSDFGYNDNQIATVMTLLGICDLFIRFAIPVITSKMKLSNQAFFSIGSVGLCIGRLALTFTSSFWMVVIVFLWMGFNKALRIVFFPLIIPGCVSLKRLPAAAGLQLLMTGMFSLIFGPIVGLVRDNSNYFVTLNVLNGLAIIALVMWGIEACLRNRSNKKISKETSI